MSTLGIDLSDRELAATITDTVKERESHGYSYEAADASFELLLAEELEGRRPAYVDVESWRVITETRPGDDALSEARRAGVIVYWLSLTGTGGPEPRAQLYPNAGLKSFVEETGGGYMRFDDLSEMNPIMTEVTEELHHQYLLGFTPAVLDGKVHKLDVKLDQSNYTVRARKTYVAEEEK